MRVAQYVGHAQTTVTHAEPPAVGALDVQISVAFVGLCGTDLHIFHGDMDTRVELPLIFGHEMSGVVTAIGSEVTRVHIGQSVTVMPLKWDGTCPACLAGNQHICQNLNFVGIDSPGALQELWTVPEDLIVTASDTVPLIDLALTEPVAVAVHDVKRSGAKPGDKVLVLGGGPIGILIATVARHAGADVRVSEVNADRRHQIEALGFPCIDPVHDDTTAIVDTWTGGAGADIVFEVSGAAPAVLSATGFAKVRGTLVIVAIHPTPRPVNLQRVFWRELTILGARVYEREDFDTAARLLSEHVIPVDVMITSVVPLEDVDSAFHRLEEGADLKILVAVAKQS